MGHIVASYLAIGGGELLNPIACVTENNESPFLQTMHDCESLIIGATFLDIRLPLLYIPSVFVGPIHGSGCSGSHRAEDPGIAVRVVVEIRQLRLARVWCSISKIVRYDDSA